MSRAQKQERAGGEQRLGLIGALAVLFGFELLGETVRGIARLPIPGPVIGMLLLAAALSLRDDRGPVGGREAAETSDLDQTADSLVSHMGLLFVPAGVGVIAQFTLLKAQWLPILGGVLGSTLLGLVVTALVMRLTMPSHGPSLPEAADLNGRVS
jgi:putative effector of murein hydrolase LrgA (UPF0299 family)